MTKTAKIWLITAIVLIAAGAAMFLCSMAMLGFDFTRLSTVKFETVVFEPEGSFDSVSIIVSTADVELVHTDEGVCRVVCGQHTNLRHSASVKDGILIIAMDESPARLWYDNIGISFGDPKITVYLPEKQYDAITAVTSTGDIVVPDRFSFDTANAAATTGDISWSANVSGALKLSASTGNIEAGDFDAGSVNMETSTGRITVSGLDCSGDVSLGASTGRVTLSSVIAGGKLQIGTTTGSVRADSCDAESVSIKTSTGSVNCSFLSPKTVQADSGTGKINIPENGGGGRCVVSTSTGNITVTTP